jgi:hypothetical protein
MTSVEEHRKAVKELEADINEKLRADIVAERQKILGFATSEAATNCFALFLHKLSLISEGTNINHKWFASAERARKKFPFDFPHKSELVGKLVQQERLRDRLCYGRSKSPEEARKAIKTFFEIKTLIEKEMGESI